MFNDWTRAFGAGAIGFLVRHIIALGARQKKEVVHMTFDAVAALKALGELISTGKGSFTVGPMSESLDIPGIGKIVASETLTVSLTRTP